MWQKLTCRLGYYERLDILRTKKLEVLGLLQVGEMRWAIFY
jgi:hypothetical protein